MTGNPAQNEEKLSDGQDWEDEENLIGRLTCIAITGIEDPVRPEVSSTAQYTTL